MLPGIDSSDFPLCSEVFLTIFRSQGVLRSQKQHLGTNFQPERHEIARGQNFVYTQILTLPICHDMVGLLGTFAEPRPPCGSKNDIFGIYGFFTSRGSGQAGNLIFQIL